MDFKVLAIGDITGERGVDHLRRHLRALKKEKSVDFVVANGENAAGNGLLPAHAEEIFAAGADVITLGNHSYGKTQITGFLEESPYILRPANFTGRAPGRGRDGDGGSRTASPKTGPTRSRLRRSRRLCGRSRKWP